MGCAGPIPFRVGLWLVCVRYESVTRMPKAPRVVPVVVVVVIVVSDFGMAWRVAGKGEFVTSGLLLAPPLQRRRIRSVMPPA